MFNFFTGKFNDVSIGILNLIIWLKESVMSDIDRLKEENIRLTRELEQLRKITTGYENVLKLNEQELENADAIIKMYENIVEYSRIELKDMTETARAREQISALSRSELLEALGKIRKLEEQTKHLREQKIKND